MGFLYRDLWGSFKGNYGVPLKGIMWFHVYTYVYVHVYVFVYIGIAICMYVHICIYNG